jgi:hypothetical protein
MEMNAFVANHASRHCAAMKNSACRHTYECVDTPSQRYFKIFCMEMSLEVGYFSSVSPPETSETFCLPAETNGIISRKSAPIFSIGWFLPASRSSR